jgi:TfoX/Sxy family transcriptional regulator of competence genes
VNVERKTVKSAATRGDGSLILHLQDLVQGIVASYADLTRRKMLVSDGWFVADKAFALVSRDARIVLRIPDPAVQDELLSLPGANAWQIANRAPMRGWIQLPESLHDDEQALRVWLQRAAQLAAALPAKKRPARKTGVPKSAARSRPAGPRERAAKRKLRAGI